jgi:hypothetical protein
LSQRYQKAIEALARARADGDRKAQQQALRDAIELYPDPLVRWGHSRELLATSKAAGDPLDILDALDASAAAHIAQAKVDRDWAGAMATVEELRLAADRQQDPSYQLAAAIQRASLAMAMDELEEADSILESAATLTQEIDPKTPLYESPNSLPLLYARVELARRQQNFVGVRVLEKQIQALEVGGEPSNWPGPLAALGHSLRRPPEIGAFARNSRWVINAICILVLLRWLFGALGLVHP